MFWCRAYWSFASHEFRKSFRIEETDCRDHRMASKEDGKLATKHASKDKVNQFECVCVCHVFILVQLCCVHFTNMWQVVIGLLQHLSLFATDCCQSMKLFLLLVVAPHYLSPSHNVSCWWFLNVTPPRSHMNHLLVPGTWAHDICIEVARFALCG